MNKKRFIIGTALALIIFAGCSGPAAHPTVGCVPSAVSGAFPVTVKDGLGKDVTVKKQPVKIASLTLGTDEVLLDLVGPGCLVGVTYLASDKTTSNIADRPELKQIKNTLNDDPEKVIALSPDLVFAGQFTKPEVVDQLRNAKITVFVVGNYTSIAAMEDNIRTMGKLVGEDAKAKAMTDAMDQKLAEIAGKLKAAQGQKPSVLYLAAEGWSAGSVTTVDDIITHAGGVNAAASLNDWNQLSPEKVILLNPDFVVLSPYVTDQDFLKNPAYKDMAAIKNNHVTAPSDAHMSATSQYIVLAVEDVAKVLFPDLMK